MKKINIDILPFYRWNWLVKLLLCFSIAMFSLLCWYAFVFKPLLERNSYILRYLKRPSKIISIHVVKKSSVQLDSAWLKNPYQNPEKFLSFSAGIIRWVEKSVPVNPQVSSEKLELKYKGEPSSLLPFLWYFTAPAAYLRFSAIQIRCGYQKNCQINFTLMPARNNRQPVNNHNINGLLWAYFSRQINGPAKLSSQSVFQLHLLGYFYHDSHALALLGSQEKNVVVKLGDVLGVEHAKITAIRSTAISVSYDELGHQEILSFS